MIKCNVCGCEFPAVIDKHYIARDDGESGISTVFRSVEGCLYDAFDCPMCGCQVIVQERKRDHVHVSHVEIEEEYEEEAENE